jgi:hypothetical protein
MPCPFHLPRLLSSHTQGAKPFLRCCQLCSHSRNSQHFMEPGGSLPCSQEPSNRPYPEPDQSIPSHLPMIHFNIRPNGEDWEFWDLWLNVSGMVTRNSVYNSRSFEYHISGELLHMFSSIHCIRESSVAWL